MPLWGAPGHENGGGAMLRGGRPGSEEVGERWGREPVYQSDRGYPEAPPIVAPRVGSTHGRVYSDRVPPLGRHERQGENDGGREPALLRAGRAQAAGGGLPDRAGAGRGAREGDPPFRHDDGRPARVARLAAGE